MSLAQACERKVAYRQPDVAQRVRTARLAAPDRPAELYVYRCQLCRLWHLTKMNPHQQGG